MKILVGYKGINVGEDLMELAAMHARAFKGEVCLVTSLAGGEKTKAGEIDEARSNLEAAVKKLEGQGVVCQSHLLIRGMTPGEDLVEFAKENNIDEVIIGVKSRSKVGKIIFGSTAQFVILKAPCPVVSVK